MISADQALAGVLALIEPLGDEPVPLAEAGGRVLARDIIAPADQPPFPAAAMDGYAVNGPTEEGATFRVVGTAAAGHGFVGQVRPGAAVRIFTGAPVPRGATQVVIQEDVARSGDLITIGANPDAATHIRPAGNDFAAGARIKAPCRLTAAHIALAAAMNAPSPVVARKPVVALIATGDELVQPGETPRPDQIVASNGYGLKAMIEAEGGIARLLPIAADRPEALAAALRLAKGADLIVTMGGASVGDADLVGRVADAAGLERAFYKVRMRPGKPLLAGRLGGAPLIGLPGNPVSSMVCGHLFLRPMLRKALGLKDWALPRRQMRLASAIPANGPREHFMRATITGETIDVADRQDSALLSVLARADALVVRAPDAGPAAAGDLVDVIPL